MRIEQLIYDGLQVRRAGTPEVFLEDALKAKCGYRHALQLKGVEGKPEGGPGLLIREVELRIRQMISRYLQGCYPRDFKSGRYVLHGGITLRVDGVLGDRLVEVSVLSTHEYIERRPSHRAVLSAAVKAYILGYSEALLILFDRNSQDWSFWRVDGDLFSAARSVLPALEHITAMADGLTDAEGAAGPLACSRCPYQDTCDVPKKPEPATYLLRGVNVTADPSTMKQVENHLWGLNAVDNGRRTEVLHPSSFSLGRCDREQAYDLLGEEQMEKVEPKLRRIFDVGHALHDVIQSVLGDVISDFEAETEVCHDEIRMYGHCDGEFGGDKGIEIKSISDAGWVKLVSPKAEHKRQATIYGMGRGLEVIYYIYVNKETGELKVYDVKLDRSTWHKVCTRAANIIKTVEAGELPPQIDSDYVCRQCKYAWTCKPQRRTEPKRTFR